MKVVKVLQLGISCLLMMALLGGCNGVEGAKEPLFNQRKVEGKQGERMTKERKQIKKETLRINQYLNNMSVEEKINQLFMVTVEDALQTGVVGVGGVIFFKKDIQTVEQTKKLIENLQGKSQVPLWIGVDEEGGRVSRIGSNSEMVEVPFKEAYELGKEGEVACKEEAKRMGKVLRALGFNMDFAPVADLYNNPHNTVIGERSFGETKEVAAPCVVAFAKGLQEEGIMPVIKHFPGHGNTVQDSHEELAYIPKTLAEVEEEELVPFKEAYEAGVNAVMLGHLVLEEVDDKPVTLSERWGAYIKNYFGDEGPILITDALNMGAITSKDWGMDPALCAFLSGADILLMPENLEASKKAFKEAYEQGIITDERLNQSVKKILCGKVEQKVLVLE